MSKKLVLIVKKVNRNTNTYNKIKHSGKISSTAPAEQKVETTEEKIEKLKAAMNDAVAKQDFENAAKIRDEIKALEGGETK